MTDEKNGNTIKLLLPNRIDSSNAAQEEGALLSKLAGMGEANVVLDATNLSYISSAGLRIILHIRKIYPSVKIINVNSEVYEILEMTGFTEMLTVEKAYRVVSVDGCEVVGEGHNGKVYRIDGDNVIKTYKNGDALVEIQRERELARLALVLGLPTAISYDIVKVGDSYGSVFEMLDAKSFSNILATEPDRFDWCVSEYVRMLKKIHSITVPEGKLPHLKDKVLAAICRIKADLPDGLGDKLYKMASDIPDSDHMIHGDFHTKNIVLTKDEVLIIDMDTLSVGNPIFELLYMYNAYKGYSEYYPEIVYNFQGYKSEVAHKLWHDVLSAYFGTKDEKIINEIEEKVRCLSYAYLIDWGNRKGSSDVNTMSCWKSRLIELLPRVNDLIIDVPADDDGDGREIEVAASVDELQNVTDYVNSRLEAADCPLKVLMQIDVAVEEIFVNIAHYAYVNDGGKATVSVEISDDPKTVVITFKDSGVPYDPLKKEDPDVALSAEERQIGGLGIFMTKKIMDDMSYEYKNGQNILTLTKKL